MQAGARLARRRDRAGGGEPNAPRCTPEQLLAVQHVICGAIFGGSWLTRTTELTSCDLAVCVARAFASCAMQRVAVDSPGSATRIYLEESPAYLHGCRSKGKGDLGRSSGGRWATVSGKPRAKRERATEWREKTATQDTCCQGQLRCSCSSGSDSGGTVGGNAVTTTARRQSRNGNSGCGDVGAATKRTSAVRVLKVDASGLSSTAHFSKDGSRCARAAWPASDS